jgi:uncharacterized protein DUF4304
MTIFEYRDKITKEILKPAFKEKGFRISGTTFQKNEEKFIKIFNIQSSGYNLEDNVSFYLNIGILFPIWFELRGEELPKNPKEYDCQFRIRTDSLTGRNQCYKIKPDTNIDNLENIIRTDLRNYILPFFDRYIELEDCLNLTNDFPDSWTDCRPFIALTMIKYGDPEKGNKILDEFIPTTSESWGQELDKFRKKVEHNASS